MEKYPQIALERFDKANIWIKYIIAQIHPCLKGNILEVGAGCGSFTESYIKNEHKITLTDHDSRNIEELGKKFKNFSNVNIISKDVENFSEKFDTIIYFNVLEHIEKDDKEIKDSLDKLNEGGHLIILVPAHQKLYGNLDEAVGHFRRYDISFFKKGFKNSILLKAKYLDIMGYFLYFLNKVFFKKEVYPTKFKIFIWDKIFTPITIVIDFITGYKFGKNVLCILKKVDD